MSTPPWKLGILEEKIIGMLEIFAALLLYLVTELHFQVMAEYVVVIFF